MTELTPKEAAFCQHYVANGHNGSQAAIDAGYSKAGSRVQAVRLLKRPYIQEEIKRLEGEALKRAAAGPIKRSKAVSSLLTSVNNPPPPELAREIAAETDADKVAILTRAWVLSRLMENLEIAMGHRKRTMRRYTFKRDQEGRETEVGHIDVEVFDPNGQVANQACKLLLEALDALPDDANKVEPGTRERVDAAIREEIEKYG